MKEAKPAWASKTLWVNLVALVASIAVALGVDIGLTVEAQGALVGGIMALVNIVLRLVTKQPVTVKR